MKKLINLVLILFITSCSHIHPSKGFHKTNEYIELGTVGKKSTHILANDFNILGIPSFKGVIRLKVTPVKKTNTLHNQYKKNKWSNTTKINKDTSQINFVKIDIIDQTKVVHAINNENKSLLEYLKDTPKSSLVSSVRFACNKNIFRNLNQADAHYLRTDKKSKQWIELYSNHKKIGEIDFSNFLILDYQLSCFCWKMNQKRQVVLSSLVNQYNKCPNPSMKSVERLKRKNKKNTFKF